MSGYLIEAINEIRLQAEIADELADDLDKPDAPRAELRDLLEREFGVKGSDPGVFLWLETVVDDIAAIVTRPYSDTARELAINLRALVDDEEEEEELDEETEHRFFCLDCGVNTAAIGEYYMLHKQVWLEANPDDAGMLCVGRVEERLGRRLEPDDFTLASINDEPVSKRLRSRVRGLEEAPAA
jgi:hypothetical protein